MDGEDFFVVFIRFRNWNLFLHCICSRAPVSWYSNAAVRSDVYAARWRKTVRCETVCKNQCHTVMLLIVKCRSAPYVGDNVQYQLARCGQHYQT